MAQVDYFLKIEGIKGESMDAKHAGEIDVLSWSWGETNSGDASARGGMGAGKVSMNDFHFTMQINKATPLLMLACANGDHIKKAELVCRKAGKEQQQYLTITMSDLLVSSYQTGGSQGEVIPVDQISLNFAKIEFDYKAQKVDGTLDGTVKKGYDLKLNKAV